MPGSTRADPGDAIAQQGPSRWILGSIRLSRMNPGFHRRWSAGGRRALPCCCSGELCLCREWLLDTCDTWGDSNSDRNSKMTERIQARLTSLIVVYLGQRKSQCAAERSQCAVSLLCGKGKFGKSNLGS